jgi:hypothetical protein
MAIDALKINVDEFTSVGNITANRYSGGAASTDHPFVKGYFYVFFQLPERALKALGDQKVNIKYILTNSVEAFTPPGDRQIVTQDVAGQGGTGASYVTGQTISRDFSIQFKDFWGAPVFKAHRAWTAKTIDPFTGLMIVNGTEDFNPAAYKGRILVVQTKPILRTSGDAVGFINSDITKVFYFDGVQCLTDLSSVYDANITDNSFVKPTIQYKFDGQYMDETHDGVLAKAVDVLNQNLKNGSNSATSVTNVFNSTYNALKTNITGGII